MAIDWNQKLNDTMTMHGLKYVANLIKQEIENGNEEVKNQRDQLIETYIRRRKEVALIWSK